MECVCVCVCVCLCVCVYVVAHMRLKGLGFEEPSANVDDYLENSYGHRSISEINTNSVLTHEELTDFRNQIIRDEKHFKNAEDVQSSKSGQFEHIINHLKILKPHYINHSRALKSTR